jgi:thiamine phosphate synthase YjbQ (UPF0047 family)
MKQIVEVNSYVHDQLIDITSKVRPLIHQNDLQFGVCHLCTPHTTCGLIINENADL